MQPTTHSSPRRLLTYFVTRDSLDGAIADRCNLWYVKPTRCVHRYRVTWVASSIEDPGHLGEYSLEEIHGWFKVTPDSDLQLIKIEQWATT